MKVWYYPKLDEIYIRHVYTMSTVIDNVTCSILVSSVKNWNAFIYLGEL